MSDTYLEDFGLNLEDLKTKLKELYGEDPCYFIEKLFGFTYQAGFIAQKQLKQIIEKLDEFYGQNLNNTPGSSRRKMAWDNLIKLTTPPKDSTKPWLDHKQLESLTEMKKKLEAIYFQIYFSKTISEKDKVNILAVLIENEELEQCAAGINVYLPLYLNRMSSDPIRSTTREIILTQISQINSKYRPEIEFLYNGSTVYPTNALFNSVAKTYGIQEQSEQTVPMHKSLYKAFKKKLNQIDFFWRLIDELCEQAKTKFPSDIEASENLGEANEGLIFLNRIGKDLELADPSIEFDLYRFYHGDNLDQDEENIKSFSIRKDYLATLKETITKRLLFGNSDFLKHSHFLIFHSLTFSDLSALARAFLMPHEESRESLIKEYMSSSSDEDILNALNLVTVSNRLELLKCSGYLFENYKTGQFDQAFLMAYQNAVQSIDETSLNDFVILQKAVIDFLNLSFSYLTESKKIKDFLENKEADDRIKVLKGLTRDLTKLHQIYLKSGVTETLNLFKEKLKKAVDATQISHEKSGKVAKFFYRKLSPTESRLVKALTLFIAVIDECLKNKNIESSKSSNEFIAGPSRKY